MTISRRLMLLTAALGRCGNPSVGKDDPRSRIWTIENIVWQKEEYGGAKYAVLDGNRETPGVPFTYAFWMPPGVWVPSHTHTQQAHVAVLKGELLLGYGSKVDKTRAIPIRRDGFFVVRANEPHFEGSESETLIIGSALGFGSWRLEDDCALTKSRSRSASSPHCWRHALSRRSQRGRVTVERIARPFRTPAAATRGGPSVSFRPL